MNETKRNETKRNGYYCLLINNYFKAFLIPLFSFILLSSISCSSNEAPGNEDPGDSITLGTLTASATSNITINIANKTVYSTGKVSFTVRPYELEGTENYTVSIDSVEKATGNNSSLEFTPADFNSLTPTTKELTLSDEGLAKVNSANDLIDATAYKYDITFKFTTTSDTVSNKTVTSKSTVSLFKIVFVTEEMFKNMIKTTPKLTVTNRSDIDGREDSFEINFSILSLTDLKEILIGNTQGMNGPTRDSTFSPNASGLTTIRFGTTETGKFISSNYCKHTLIFTEAFKAYTSIHLNYIFTLKEGYILDDSISFITNEGIELHVVFAHVGKWVED